MGVVMCSEDKIRAIVKEEVAPIVELLQDHDAAIVGLRSQGDERDERQDNAEQRIVNLEDAVALMTDSQKKIDRLLQDLDRAKKVVYFIGSAVVVEGIRLMAMVVAG